VQGSSLDELMRKRRKEAADLYEAQWDEGRGSHHSSEAHIAASW